MTNTLYRTTNRQEADHDKLAEGRPGRNGADRS